jgi:multidrug efflux pump subunit AcrA (membrane-fusion protein)
VVKLSQADRCPPNRSWYAGPFDGVVARRLVNRGDLVRAPTASRTTPLFTEQRIDTIRVFCDVPENDVPRLHIGDPAIVRRDLRIGDQRLDPLQGRGGEVDWFAARALFASATPRSALAVAALARISSSVSGRRSSAG